jgi:hypothetical protein
MHLVCLAFDQEDAKCTTWPVFRKLPDLLFVMMIHKGLDGVDGGIGHI